MNYFVTAINTDSGKTLVSAILCEALHADYWKPVQAGAPYDVDTVRILVSNGKTKIHPEAFRLNTPCSPHAAAAIDGVKISLDDFKLPETDSNLVIEGAGGCLVPLNEKDFVIDLAMRFKTKVILVSNFYLGSINHTLLTVEALRRRNLEIEGIIFNGPLNTASLEIILKHTQLKCLLIVEEEKTITTQTIINYAKKLNENWTL